MLSIGQGHKGPTLGLGRTLRSSSWASLRLGLLECDDKAHLQTWDMSSTNSCLPSKAVTVHLWLEEKRAPAGVPLPGYKVTLRGLVVTSWRLSHRDRDTWAGHVLWQTVACPAREQRPLTPCMAASPVKEASGASLKLPPHLLPLLFPSPKRFLWEKKRKSQILV